MKKSPIRKTYSKIVEWIKSSYKEILSVEKYDPVFCPPKDSDIYKILNQPFLKHTGFISKNELRDIANFTNIEVSGAFFRLCLSHVFYSYSKIQLDTAIKHSFKEIIKSKSGMLPGNNKWINYKEYHTLVGILNQIKHDLTEVEILKIVKEIGYYSGEAFGLIFKALITN